MELLGENSKLRTDEIQINLIAAELYDRENEMRARVNKLVGTRETVRSMREGPRKKEERK